MPTPTLILTPRFTPDSQHLWRAAQELGWDVERLTSWRVPKELTKVYRPVLYVEGLFAQVIGEAFGFELREPPENWFWFVPDKFRQRNVWYTTIGQLKKDGPFPVFAKPPNDKSFQAKVFNSADELPVLFPDDFWVMASTPVNFVKEFRFWLDKREIKTFSIYLRDGILQKDKDFESTEEEDNEAISFVNQVIDERDIPLPWFGGKQDQIVLDVGQLDNGKWAIVEINACWGSGIYGCDPKAVLGVLKNHFPQMYERDYWYEGITVPDTRHAYYRIKPMGESWGLISKCWFTLERMRKPQYSDDLAKDDRSKDAARIYQKYSYKREPDDRK